MTNISVGRTIVYIWRKKLRRVDKLHLDYAVFIYCLFVEIYPEMHADEMHELYNRHYKVSPTLNSC